MILLLFYLVVFFFMVILLAKEDTILNNRHVKGFLSTCLVLISFYSVYITDLNYTDRYVYSKYFREMKDLTFKETLELYSHEPLFLILSKTISLFTTNEKIYYLLIYAVFFITLYKGLGLIFKNSNKFVVILLFLNYIFYYMYVFNGIRQGIALSLIVLVMGYALNRKIGSMIIASICAFFFHYSSLPIIISIFFLYKFSRIKIKYFLLLFVFFSLLFITHYNEIVFSIIGNIAFGAYSSSELIQQFGGSNKIRFLLFNAGFLMIFTLYLKRFRKNEVYIVLYKSYIIFSIYFFAFGYIAFSNRLSIYSWFLIPIISGFIVIFNRNRLISVIIVILFIASGFFGGITFFYNGHQ